MGRIAGKAPVSLAVKKAVVSAKNETDFITKMKGEKTKYSDIELNKLWNRRSAFRKELLLSPRAAPVTPASAG